MIIIIVTIFKIKLFPIPCLNVKFTYKWSDTEYALKYKTTFRSLVNLTTIKGKLLTGKFYQTPEWDIMGQIFI